MLANLGTDESSSKGIQSKRRTPAHSPVFTTHDNRPRGTVSENDKVMAEMANINYRGRHAKPGQELPGTDFVLTTFNYKLSYICTTRSTTRLFFQ